MCKRMLSQRSAVSLENNEIIQSEFSRFARVHVHLCVCSSYYRRLFLTQASRSCPWNIIDPRVATFNGIANEHALRIRCSV